MLYHPLLLTGKGKIKFGKSVQIGVTASPYYYSHYAYIQSRFAESEVVFGNGVAINNGFSAVAYSKITIGDHVLIGTNCTVIDNDGHNLHPKQRNIPGQALPVFIGENVFLGNNVTVLKGVSIGKNSVIGSNAVVTRDIPENVVAAGNPAIIIRNLQVEDI